MLLTYFNAFCLILLGCFGFFKWDMLHSSGSPIEMLMLTTFGGGFLLCALLSKVLFPHALYGGFILALAAIGSALLRLWDYGFFTNQAKSFFILAFLLLSIFQSFNALYVLKKVRTRDITYKE